MKQINVKQAEKWLEKLKTENQQSYKDITKFLRKYEKTEDEYDCYVKISHTLLSHSDLTKEINGYLEEGNKFVINKPEDEKVKELMAYVKKNRNQTFNKIIEMINVMCKNKDSGDSQELNSNLKSCLREIVKGDEELEKKTEEALDLTGQQLINRQDLEHLRVNRVVQHIDEDEDLSIRPQPQVVGRVPKVEFKNVPTGAKQMKEPIEKPMPKRGFTNFTSVSEEKIYFKHLEKNVNEPTFHYIIKVMKIFQLNIITKAEAYELLTAVQIEDEDLDGLKDIFESRQTERRKQSVFKPLNDMNFSHFQRASPSYVTLPFSYPIKCSGRTEPIRKLMNQKWVSVPHGSEESQNFSVRNKNSNEINLLKAQDERYEFDLYMRRLEKTLMLLEKVLEEKRQTEKEKHIKKIIEMGIVQLIYKNCNKDQREELEWFLKINSIEACKVIKERVQVQIHQLRGIKEVHANKNWSEVASKNYFKALDLKGFQFKKNQKQRMKGTFFIAQLNQRNKILQSGGQKTNLISFEDKKEFFTILNSFQSSSRTQKCYKRALPEVEVYDLKDEKRRHFYPLLILAFEDTQICQKIYSLIIFYIDSTQINEPEKFRCKIFLEQFLIGYLGWKKPLKKNLSENFDEEKLYTKISKTSSEEINTKNWLIEVKDDYESMINENDEESIAKLKFLNDKASEYSYLPVKSQKRSVLYGSESMYTFVRFIYALYERMIKMKEVADDSQTIEVFELLFYACIKAKEGIKFEQSLNLLFGKHAYLFSTLYKLFDNLIKSISSVCICPLSNYSYKLLKEESEDIYFVLLNRFCLANNISGSKMLRLTFEKDTKILYFNYLESYYKVDDSAKEVIKKRSDINRGIEIYTLESFGATEKRRKVNEVIEINDMEYVFQGNTIRMLNHHENEDILLHTGKRQIINKLLKRELKRSHKLVAKVN